MKSLLLLLAVPAVLLTGCATDVGVYGGPGYPGYYDGYAYGGPTYVGYSYYNRGYYHHGYNHTSTDYRRGEVARSNYRSTAVAHESRSAGHSGGGESHSAAASVSAGHR